MIYVLFNGGCVCEYVLLGLCMVRGVCAQWYMVYNERHV